MPPHRPGFFHRAPDRVRIVEVGPRDGLQNEAALVPSAVKVAFVDALSAAGLTHIEVSSFVSPRRIPQLADAGKVFGEIRRRPGTVYWALVPNEEGLRRALDAGVDSIAVFTAASETFNQKNIGCGIEESLFRIRKVLKEARTSHLKVRGYVSTAFACPHEGAIAPDAVIRVARALRDAGVHSISIGDTLGVAFPDQVARLVERIDATFGTGGFALHLHDTRRRALANALAGLLLGIEEFDSSAGGLGGCPFAPGARGNVATEELVELFEGMGIATGVDAAKVEEASAGIIRHLRPAGGGA